MQKGKKGIMMNRSSDRHILPVAVIKLLDRMEYFFKSRVFKTEHRENGHRAVFFRKPAGCQIAAFVLLTFLIVLAAFPSDSVCAASCKLIFSSSANDIKVDDETTVELTLDGEVIPGIFEGYISYDPEIIEYVSGPDCIAGGEGTLRISDMGYESSTLKRTYTLKFKGLKMGSTDIAMRGKPEVYEADLGYLMSVSSNVITVSVQASERASSDASLALLRISPGSLDPGFDPAVTEYSVHLPYEVTDLVVSAASNDGNASVKIEGNTGLNVGQNRILLLVTAEDGTTGKYVIYAVRSPEEDQEEPEISGQESVSGAGSEGSENSTAIPEGWSFYAENNGNEAYLVSASKFRICSGTGDLELPAGYTKTSIRISGVTVTAFVPANAPESDYLLLVLQREGSEPSLYSFDRKEKTLQRFDSNAMASGNKTASGYSTIEEEELVKGYEKSLGTMTMVIAILSGVCMLLLIIVIRMALRRKNELD